MKSLVLWMLVPLMTFHKVHSHWWGYIAEPLIAAHEKGTAVECQDLAGLSKNQKSLCERYIDHMPFIGEGARNGMSECQWQFKNQRWNCSTSTDPASFKKMMKIGSKEAAFTYAIAASAVVHSIAKACGKGKLEHCGCSVHPRPKGLGADWEWGGCGDNTEHAYGFAREFLDAKELDSISPNDKLAKSRKLMNVHNNEAGRLAVVRAARPVCKCHGVSGACSVKTCWMNIPEFRKIGQKLKEAYTGATETKMTKRGQLRDRMSSRKKPAITSLVYFDSSPDYCTSNKVLGVSGTKGRVCNESGDENNCNRICCGRRHETTVVEVVEQCRCNFKWCCVVECETCNKRVVQHVCT